MGDGKNREVEAAFNMAVATLERLHIILQQIKNLNFQYKSGTSEKQIAHIDLIKQFYLNATPLLGDDAKGYEDRVLNLVMTKKLYINGGTQVCGYVYNDNLEKKLNKILIDMQLKLKKYFMPGKKASEGLI